MIESFTVMFQEHPFGTTYYSIFLLCLSLGVVAWVLGDDSCETFFWMILIGGVWPLLVIAVPFSLASWFIGSPDYHGPKWRATKKAIVLSAFAGFILFAVWYIG